MNLGFLLPRSCLELNISKSVTREDASHFLKEQQRKSEGKLNIEFHSESFWSTNIYVVPGTVLNARDKAVNIPDNNPSPCVIYIPGGHGGVRQTIN